MFFKPMEKEYSPRDLFDKRAEEYQQKFMDVSAYSDGLDFFYDCLLSNSSNLLDIACGPGNLSRYLLNKNSKLNILGTDIAPNMIRLARNNNPEAAFEKLDCREILQLKKKFDGILCGFCFPYLSDTEVKKIIEDCSALLNDDGILYISTMENINTLSALQTSSYGEQLYTYFHPAKELEKKLHDAGFDIIYQKKQAISNGQSAVINDLILVAKKMKRVI